MSTGGAPRHRFEGWPGDNPRRPRQPRLEAVAGKLRSCLRIQVRGWSEKRGPLQVMQGALVPPGSRSPARQAEPDPPSIPLSGHGPVSAAPTGGALHQPPSGGHPMSRFVRLLPFFVVLVACGGPGSFQGTVAGLTLSVKDSIFIVAKSDG